MNTDSDSKYYQGVLFDLDGTLIDTADDFIACLNDLRQEFDLPELDANEVRKVVSDGARAMIKLAFNLTPDDAEFESIKQRFLDLYVANIARNSALFPGLDDLLQWCESHDIPWGIVTNKGRIYSEALVNALGLDQGISSLVCPDDVSQTKPHPEPLFKACKEIQLAPEQCLYVGDHARDIESGKRANMATIAAAYGYVHSDEEAQSWQADWCVDSPQALSALLKTLLRPASGKHSPQAAN